MALFQFLRKVGLLLTPAFVFLCWGCGGNCSNTRTAPVWAPTDYDSLWTLILDAQGNLTADFTQCEGIDSAALPAAAPQF